MIEDSEKINVHDPISYLADIAGYQTGELWWDETFELVNSRDFKEHFKGVSYVMQSLREEGIASKLE